MYRHRSSGLGKETPMKRGKRKATLMSIAAVLALFFTVYNLYGYMGSFYSVGLKVQELSEAFEARDTEMLKEEIDGTEITTYEAQAYFNYIDQEVGMDAFIDMVIESGHRIGQNESKAESIKDGDLTLLQIQRAEDKWGVFENYTFSIPKHNINVENEKSIPFVTEVHGEQRENAGRDGKIAELIPGLYEFPLKTTIREESFHGMLTIPFDVYSDGDLVHARLDFNFSWLTMHPDIPSLSGAGIDADDYTYMVNGKPAKLRSEETQEYGPYPLDMELVVRGIIELDEASFMSEPATVTITGEDNEKYDGVYPVDLEFDKEKITEHITASAM